MAVLRHRSTRRGGCRSNQNNDSSQMSRSDGVNTTAPLSQNSEVIPRQPSSRHKGRKRRATTELRVPPHGHRVGLEPEGDRQFNYADPNSKHYKYTMHLESFLNENTPA